MGTFEINVASLVKAPLLKIMFENSENSEGWRTAGRLSRTLNIDDHFHSADW